MAYNAATGVITAPVSIRDLQKCFLVILSKTTSGVTTRKQSADLGTILSTIVGSTVEGWTVESRIYMNMWAKYKPVIKASIVRALTDAERASVNYGINNIPTWDNINKMATFWLLENHSSATNYPECGLKDEYWAYEIPQGTLTAPLRITDYAKSTTVGYYHNAQAPVGPLTNTQLQITPNGQLVIGWPTGEQEDMTLKYTDLKYYNGSQISLSGFYFTAMLIRTNATGTKYVMTDENQSAVSALQQGVHCRPWFQDLAAVNSFLNNGESEQFYCMVFLCNQEIYDTFTKTSSGTTTTYRKFLTSLGSLSADKFVALFARQTVTISKKYAEITIDYLAAGWESSSSHNVAYVAVLTNTESDVNRAIRVTIELLTTNDVLVTSGIVDVTITGGSSVTLQRNLSGGQQYSSVAKLRLTASFQEGTSKPVIYKDNTEVVIVGSTPPSPPL